MEPLLKNEGLYNSSIRNERVPVTSYVVLPVLLLIFYLSKKRESSCDQLRCSACAVANALPKGFIKTSTSVFPWGHSSVDIECSTPMTCIYRAKSSESKEGPLSLLAFCGTPCLEKMVSIFKITFCAAVDMISTSGYWE